MTSTRQKVILKFAEEVGDRGTHPYTYQEAYDSLMSAYSTEPREPRAFGKKVVGDGFAHTDYGNAERLVARHGENTRYWTPWKAWLTWDGKRWRKHETSRRSND